ncbi:hypothetical protein HYALB_00010343 [Hymenoscyphus albidus]|uniref:Uncharacterized protein n=1 Tax=Hymenoscyphus albidus TaxID=595503 RepID=A0A9N9LJH7_9HELO|nr:hypothetical protein HYALB_00010343 [Hymenoscyphus albidus]
MKSFGAILLLSLSLLLDYNFAMGMKTQKIYGCCSFPPQMNGTRQPGWTDTCCKTFKQKVRFYGNNTLGLIGPSYGVRTPVIPFLHYLPPSKRQAKMGLEIS